MAPSRMSRDLLLRLSAAGVSTLVAIGIGYVWLRSRAPAEPVETVVTVDRSKEFDELLDRRRMAGGGESEVDTRLLVMDEADREQLTKIFHRMPAGHVSDRLTFYRRESNLDLWRKMPEHPDGGYPMRTNSLGMRNDEDPATTAPDVRVLVTGDSHTDGVCANAENFVHITGDLLRERWPERSVETLNAGTGGYNLYHYLGVLERYLGLAPDVFVVAVYGGNDFSGAMKFQRYFRRRPRPARDPHGTTGFHKAGLMGTALNPQELKQLAFFLDNPGEVPLAVDTAVAITARIAEICREHGIALVCVYIPPPLIAQPRYNADAVRTLRAYLGDEAPVRDPSDEIADGWLAYVREQELPALDLRPVFLEVPRRLYWRADQHINLEANRLVARLLEPLVAEALSSAPGADPSGR